MSVIERVKRGTEEAIVNLRFKERQHRFRKYVDRSAESEVINGTVTCLQDVAGFLLDNKTALKTLGANDGDFDLLRAVTDPVVNRLKLHFDYDTIYPKNRTVQNEIQISSIIDTRKDSTKLMVAVITNFVGDKINFISIRYQASDSESKQILPEGFNCVLFDKAELDSQQRDELVTKKFSVHVSPKSRRVNIINGTGLKSEKIDFNYVGELNMHGAEKGVMVNVIRKNKKSSGGGRKLKESIKRREPYPEFGVI